MATYWRNFRVDGERAVPSGDLFTLKIHHGGRFFSNKGSNREYRGGEVLYLDSVDPDKVSLPELNNWAWDLGYKVSLLILLLILLLISSFFFKSHMACLHTMYNSEHKGQYCNGGSGGALMSPRISFSNDFADAQHVIKHERSSREAPVSSDFEFSVTNYSMMSADQLFSKGRLLPYKGSNKSQMQRSTTTLRDELLVEDREDDVSSHRPPKGSSTRWKGLLGRKRTAHIGSKKAEKASEGSSKEERRSGLVHESSSQEVLNEGGSSWRGFEMGI